MKSIAQVYRLIDLFSKIEYGEIRVPIFQRPFAWKAQDVLKLIESIYNGLPIGTFVFWESWEKMFETASPSDSKLPEAPERLPVRYIIDGVQRLSSLYNCFNWKRTKEPNKFNIIFDIDAEKFLPYGKRNMPSNYIHLSWIFSSNAAFVEDENSSTRRAMFHQYMNTIAHLQSIFQTYEINVVTLHGDELDDVIAAFEAINMSGVKLTNKDLLRAEKVRKTLGFEIKIKRSNTEPNKYDVQCIPRELQQPYKGGRPTQVPQYPKGTVRFVKGKPVIHWAIYPERLNDSKKNLEEAILERIMEYERFVP
jgi:hypothetical protein